ncbi:MAG: hypothetical protein P8126_06505 [Gammaproteobacteria bacterium]
MTLHEIPQAQRGEPPLSPWRIIDASRGEVPAPEQLSAGLFAGELIIFRGVDAVRDLVSRGRTVVEEAFESDSPWLAEGRLPEAEFQDRVRRARKRVQNDAGSEDAWQQILATLGFPSEEMLRDRLRLRVVPSRSGIRSRTSRPLEPHRDSWGSGIMAQVNWWLPLYPLAPTRTMLIWPGRFDCPVDNTSAEWDYDTLMRQRGSDYPLLPVARLAPPEPGEPVLIEPGELLAFSAVHLHAGIADESGLTRLSLDTRTVWRRDVEEDRGAPNVDGAPHRPHWEMFSR